MSTEALRAALADMIDLAENFTGLAGGNLYPNGPQRVHAAHAALAAQAAEHAPITDATYLGLAEDIARLTAEGEALKLFALAMLEHWPLGDVDGGELQEEAVKHGLLVPETRTAVCSEEGCNCAEYYSAEEWAEGITCYRKAAWLKGMAT